MVTASMAKFSGRSYGEMWAKYSLQSSHGNYSLSFLRRAVDIFRLPYK